MEFLFNFVLNIFTKIFETIGLVAGANPCVMYYDEPEVPEELSKIYE
ncbi:cyclic lactone autoinducer peptide AgrD [Staphylococcus warneri]|mgnify:CR=1 FL=1|jgi:AgrD protein|nr:MULTISPECIES: cyclic lactone autoinducer peptide [Staphylococcus]QAV32214.1 cyclic lactone autoinducer peptide [Sulfitobacter donghicola]AGZ24791.1 AgrD family protein [Staphylococcus pasteuri SP1]KAB7644020.1 cyclic lactone autoinducer peptide [Staphylococcus sp. B2-b]MBN6853789.1 cyclic lactone autoinducer peptide [Staphylococcus warneri]MBT2770338.1 cyclic lactone autoinducer peptide [Staphylococcus warneri]